MKANWAELAGSNGNSNKIRIETDEAAEATKKSI